MNSKTLRRCAILGLGGAGLALAGCEGSNERQRTTEARHEMPVGQQESMGGMQGMEGMAMDTAMMRRHAQELDAMAEQMRQHLQQVRQRSAEQQHEQMAEHVAHVARMLGLMNRQMREIDRGMGMTDQQMGQMMGVSGDEHRRMMQEMHQIRAELEQLQTATAPQVREQMAGHLNRVERMLRSMEQAARHMASM